jgi:very-short-patch-repair endonuclease
MKYHEAKEYARQMRLNPTKAERILWGYLRKRQLGNKKFLRQHPIYMRPVQGESFYYIPDFYCYEGKLAIEMDGEIHDFKRDEDFKRDNELSNQGITVLRFHNEELKNVNTVLEKILKHFNS